HPADAAGPLAADAGGAVAARRARLYRPARRRRAARLERHRAGRARDALGLLLPDRARVLRAARSLRRALPALLRGHRPLAADQARGPADRAGRGCPARAPLQPLGADRPRADDVALLEEPAPVLREVVRPPRGRRDLRLRPAARDEVGEGAPGAAAPAAHHGPRRAARQARDRARPALRALPDRDLARPELLPRCRRVRQRRGLAALGSAVPQLRADD